jgi:hypothetical protein
MGFENDIMISYAWRDNQPPPLSESEGWVSNFQAVLEFYLKQYLRRQPTVWRDKNQMPCNKVFASELDEVVAKVALLLTVVSEPYLGSEWCARELENFIQHATKQGGVTVDNDYRIFKVNKLPVDRNVIPEPLKPVTGFDFYEIDPETRFLEPIDPSLGEEETTRFRKKVSNVAESMARLLLAIDRKGLGKSLSASTSTGTSVSSPPTVVDDKPEIVVYLPHTSKELRGVRDDLVSELQRRGCIIVPEHQIPWVDIDDFNKSFADDIAKASISIHLIGTRYGTILDGETRSVFELQNLYAAEESRKRGLRRLIWMPKDMGEMNEQQAQFIAKLRSDRNSLEGADLLEETVENLKSSVLDMLKPKPVAKVTTVDEAVVSDGSLQLYLLYDVKDKDAVRELRRELKGKTAGEKPLNVVVPAFDGEASELRELHRQKLKECDAVMIYWGSSNEAWVDSSLNEIRKAPGFGRTKKFSTKHLVLLAGPQTSTKSDWLLDYKDGFLQGDIHALDAITAMPVEPLTTYLNTIT